VKFQNELQPDDALLWNNSVLKGLTFLQPVAWETNLYCLHFMLIQP